MKKATEIIKQVFAGIGAVAIAVVLFLLGRGTKKNHGGDVGGGASLGSEFGTLTEEKIEGKCNEKRNEALERLSNTDARVLSENYGAVCDAITDGKLRFRKRCEDATRRKLDGKGNSDYGNR